MFFHAFAIKHGIEAHTKPSFLFTCNRILASSCSESSFKPFLTQWSSVEIIRVEHVLIILQLHVNTTTVRILFGTFPS